MIRHLHHAPHRPLGTLRGGLAGLLAFAFAVFARTPALAQAPDLA